MITVMQLKNETVESFFTFQTRNFFMFALSSLQIFEFTKFSIQIFESVTLTAENLAKKNLKR